MGLPLIECGYFSEKSHNHIVSATPTIRLPKQQIVSLQITPQTPCNFTEHCTRFSVVSGYNRIIVTLKVVTSIELLA